MSKLIKQLDKKNKEFFEFVTVYPINEQQEKGFERQFFRDCIQISL